MSRHQERILGVLCGFDRVLFRGTLRTISYAQGANAFLCAKGIRLKDFAEFAHACSEDIAAHARQVAQEAGRPYIYLNSSSERKEDRARTLAERDGIQQGLVCVLYSVEPCLGFDIYKNRAAQKIELVTRQRKCRFFYFYYMDREFGLLHVRIQSWFPFEVQVCLNGHSYLARQMDREGIAYEQRRNCFASIENLPRAQALFDRLERRDWAKTLNVFARRVNPLPRTRLRGVFSYYWSVRQCEFATDILFKDRTALAEVYPALWQHALRALSSADVMRFLGKRQTRAFSGEATTDLDRRPEGVRIKHSVDGNSIKMYDKEETVLRVETTINNPRWFRVLRRTSREGRPALAWLPMRKGVSDTPRRADISRAANARYLDALAVVGEETPSHRILDSVSKPVTQDGHTYRALHPASPDEAALFQAILHGEHLLHGFTNSQIHALLWPHASGTDPTRRKRSAALSRKFRLLRAHGLLRKVSRTHRYRITPRGHQIMTTALLFRHSDVALLRLTKAG